MTDLAPILALVMAAVSITVSCLPRRRHAPRVPEHHRQLSWDSRAACAEIDASARRTPQLRLMDTRLPARQDNPREAR
jgi:hypothetical protein